MEFLSNIGEERLGDALAESIGNDAKLSIISSYFTVFAYGELKDALSKVEELRFVFSEPTFVKRMQDAGAHGVRAEAPFARTGHRRNGT